MARVKGAVMTRKRRKKTTEARQGLLGALRASHFKMAKQAVMKSGQLCLHRPKAEEARLPPLCGSPVFRLPAA